MASFKLPFFFLFISLLAFLHAFAHTHPGVALSAGAACKSTVYYSFCRSVLPQTVSPATVYDYGRYAVRRSLSTTQKLLSLVNGYLQHPGSLTPPAARALEDCRALAGLNIEFLDESFRTVDATNGTLPARLADDLQTLLSAILTNHQTCLDGLQATATASAWWVKDGLAVPLSNNTKLYSVSLALVTNGWVPKNETTGWRGTHRRNSHFEFDGDLPSLRPSPDNRKVDDALSSLGFVRTAGANDPVVLNGIAVVGRGGGGNFTRINEAVAAAPNHTDGSAGYFLIHVTAGVYHEYVTVPKNKAYLMMIGDGTDKTFITGNRSVVDGWTTYNSATFAVTAPRFVAANITFRNTAGPEKHQAVAVRNGADLSAFYRCRFEGYQDTLYAHSLRQFYRDCDISGTVDFIFGNAAAVFQNCNMHPRLPMSGQFNAVTAQGRTDPNQNTGISIQNCNIRAAKEVAAGNRTTKTYLGRPWKEYSRTIYMESFMDGSIEPSGWVAWSGDFALNTSYYAEFNNTGPGSSLAQRVTWPAFRVINASDAGNFTASSFLMGDVWLPQTGVPYAAGLQ